MQSGEHEKPALTLRSSAPELLPKARIPAVTQSLQLVVENLHPHLKHLLFLHHPLTDDLVDRRLNEGCRNPLLVRRPFAEVGNEGTVARRTSQTL
jgi:hypothetical protein